MKSLSFPRETSPPLQVWFLSLPPSQTPAMPINSAGLETKRKRRKKKPAHCAFWVIDLSARSSKQWIEVDHILWRHNVASREQRVTRPHSDTIRKVRKHSLDDLFIYYIYTVFSPPLFSCCFFFFLFRHGQENKWKMIFWQLPQTSTALTLVEQLFFCFHTKPLFSWHPHFFFFVTAHHGVCRGRGDIF